MNLTLQWLGHASFRICCKGAIVYIDPWKLKDSPHDATHVLVSHSHYDHYSPDDIAKVSGPDTQLMGSADVIQKHGKGTVVKPGQTLEWEGIGVSGVPAYNPNKQFHPKANDWAGFIVELGPKHIYYAGDTDITEEMKALRDVDVALLPVGGTYTMDAAEAAKASEHFKPKMAIPYHFGDIVGGENDAKKFSELCHCEVRILKPGETLSLG